MKVHLPRISAIYRIWILPSDFEPGSWLPYDQGMVFVDQLPACTVTGGVLYWTIAFAARWVDHPAEAQHPELTVMRTAHPIENEVSRMRDITVPRLDNYGMFLEGKGLEDERVLWRLEPLRPGVHDQWHEIYDRLRAHRPR